jgi:hypothetical protein
MIKARVRAGESWNDALILNMSTRGLLVRSDRPASRGSYLEIRRGPYVIVARVVWSSADRFGVQTQDPVPAAALIRDPDGARATAVPAETKPVERRSVPRLAEVSHETSRQKARIAEFAAIALACCLVALLIGNALFEVVARPLRAAEHSLAAN